MSGTWLEKWKSPSPTAVVLFVAAFYLSFTLVALWIHDWDPLWFMWVGDRYAQLDPNGRIGYDGQFIYYLAQDGFEAIPHLDNPPYRLQRIFLAVVVRFASLGLPALIPWATIAVNLAAILITTALLAHWLQSQQITPWYVALYALSTGLLMAYSRNLTEPLAFCLAAYGTLCWWKQRMLSAVIALAAATLTKEISLLFIAGLVLAELVQKHGRQALFLSLSAIPLLVWEIYLWQTFQVLPLSVGPGLEIIPLAGALPNLIFDPAPISAIFFIGLPALAFIPLALYGLTRQPQAGALWILLLNAVLMVLMVPVLYEHIMGAGRNAVGMFLVFVFSLPFLKNSIIRLGAAVCWIFPTFIWLIPVLRWAPWLQEI